MKIKNILVSQPRPATEKSPYFDMEARYGVHFDFRQLIRVEQVSTKEFRATHINILDFTAVLFNSRHGIDHFFNLCEQLRVNVPETMHYYCISESVANYLQKYIQYRKRKVFFGPNNRFEDVLPAMQRRPTERYMMVLSDVHNDDVIRMFASHGIKVTPVVMYRTVVNHFPESEKRNYDMFVLFTPKGVDSFRENFPNFKQGKQLVACMGQNTLQALTDAGIKPAAMAPSKEHTSITSAINELLFNNEKEFEKRSIAAKKGAQTKRKMAAKAKRSQKSKSAAKAKTAAKPAATVKAKTAATVKAKTAVVKPKTAAKAKEQKTSKTTKK